MAGGRLAAAFSLAGLWLLAACGSRGLDPATLALVRQAHERMLTVDPACRISAGLPRPDRKSGDRPEGRRSVAERIGLPRMEEGGLDAAFFSIAVPQGEPTAEGYAAARASAFEAIDAVVRMTGDPARRVDLALTPADAYRAEKAGRAAAFLGLDNAYLIGDNISLLADLYELGIRMLTLCGDRDNLVCDAAAERKTAEDRGLSVLGRRVVAECNRLGVIIDLANASERSFFDVVAASRAPVIVSRAASRALCDRPENLTDEMVRAVAGKGGVVHVCLIPELLLSKEARRPARLADAADHIDHMVGVAGEGSVGISTDFGGRGGLPGCRDVGEIVNLTWEALRRGYAESAVESLWGGNIMRLFEEVERVAGRR